MRPTWAEIDLGAIRHNLGEIARLVAPAEVCAVVKADAYGHGDGPVATAALDAGASCLAVALVEEGVRLREAGIDAPIILLSEPPPEAVPEIVRWRLTPAAYGVEFIDLLAEASSRVTPIHLKVDTGMHRVGAQPDRLMALVDRVRAHRELELAAVWTHFPVADDDVEFTEKQIDRFDSLVGDLDVPVHMANTAGAIRFPRARRDLVRIGLGMYGLHPCEQTRPIVDLRPAMRIVSRVTYVQSLPSGARPSYGRRRPLQTSGTVATVPIGYADGMPRRLSETGGEVLIGGRRFPLAGTVTMDQIMVEVGDVPVNVGDEVVLIGTQGASEISADEWAANTGTISYEIVCSIGPRVPREHVT